MGILGRLFGGTPFKMLLEHTKKVHECVALLRPLTNALLEKDYEEIKNLHHQMSRTEHEADEIKQEIREHLSRMLILSVGRQEFKRFLSVQDSLADAAEDYAVVLSIRNTEVPEELREDFLAFVDQVIKVSEHLLHVAEKLSLLVESAFSGEEAKQVIETIDQIGKEEWEADKLQRRFARHCYAMEDTLDTMTLIFLDKYCRVLSQVANNAEKTGKYLRMLITG